jgi:hypothetical protein
VAEFEAHRLLGATLAPPRAKGFDAVVIIDGRRRRVQIKGRCIVDTLNPGSRIGSVRARRGFDDVLLVLLDSRYDATEIRCASRHRVLKALDEPGSRARNVRRALSIAKFRQIGRQIWPSGARKSSRSRD